MQSDCDYSYLSSLINYFCIGIIGFLLYIIVIYVHIKDDFLRKAPGDLLLIKFHFQLAFHLHFISGWPFWNEYSLNRTIQNSFACTVFGVLGVVGFYGMWMYCLCVSIEIMLKIVYPYTSSSTVPSQFYHIACCSITIAAAIYCINMGFIGESFDETCFIVIEAMDR